MVKTDDPLVVDGKRLDGRKMNELRKINIKLAPVERADGSAQISFGSTEAIVAAYGPKELYPRFMQEADTGIVRVRYNMAPFSVIDRKRPGPSRRAKEISKVLKFALQPALFLEDFPKVTIDVFIEILQADGSTRVTGLNGASLALAMSGVPMRDLVVSCSVGKIDGQLIADLNGIEDNNSDADVAFAMMPSKGLVTLLQMDGRVTKEELKNLLQMAKEKVEKIYEVQKKALKDHYKSIGDDVE